MRILKTSTYESLLKTIADKEREINKLKLSAQQFEDSSRIAMQQRNDDIKKLSSHCQKLQEDLDQAKQENDVIAKSLDIANEKLDRNKRYQKEAAQKNTENVKTLKGEIKAQKDTLDENEKAMKKMRAEITMFSDLYQAGVQQLAKFMRTTPGFKSKPKKDVQELADEMICNEAKAYIDSLPKDNPKKDDPEMEVTKKGQADNSQAKKN